ncbi:hypothetical protein [Adlercreutzia sp. ZJ304]|uniref:hypothetical protein n=1 Tax=Adlercreutzia sp. ZJ304 TaxID=2709791 RepID=UPI0013ECEC6B|nr:hypothetical protein [Adlercreutzia sp. ZJ304]
MNQNEFSAQGDQPVPAQQNQPISSEQSIMSQQFAQAMQPKNRSTMGIISLVLGIISTRFSWCHKFLSGWGFAGMWYWLLCGYFLL